MTHCAKHTDAAKNLVENRRSKLHKSKDSIFLVEGSQFARMDINVFQDLWDINVFQDLWASRIRRTTSNRV